MFHYAVPEWLLIGAMGMWVWTCSTHTHSHTEYIGTRHRHLPTTTKKKTQWGPSSGHGFVAFDSITIDSGEREEQNSSHGDTLTRCIKE